MKTPPRSGVGSRLRARRISTRSKRSRAAAVLILLVLILTTLVLGRFGFEDFTKALTFPGRITGAILLMVSTATLLGAFAVVDHWVFRSFRYSGTFVLISTIAAFCTNGMLVLKIWTGGDSVFYLALLGMLMLGSGLAAVVVWRTSIEIPSPKRVAAALIISSLFAAANFGYQNLFQPARRGARPVITLAMGDPVLNKDRKVFSLPVDIKIENRSDMGFYVLGAEFHAMGERVTLSKGDRDRQQWRSDALGWQKFQDKNPLSRREVHQAGELVAAQPWMFPGFWIDAKDEFCARTLVELPINTKYDQVALYATASLARKDQLGLDSFKFNGYSWESQAMKVPQWVRGSDKNDFLAYHAKVHENNAIDERTMGRRNLDVYWTFGVRGVKIAASITRNGKEAAESEEFASRYGLLDAMTGPIERTLWDIKGKR
ncbi:hypothetical protein [Streptomyces sasae]|uniref:hypothetical protein n=1 Tax=Streptomyces sasae TaxID=1266772 RepID=UPI00292DCDDF|nr:hypothetical protein [Streptomyces sasae]